MKLYSCTPNLMVKNVKEAISYYQNYLGFQLTSTVPEEDAKEYIWARITNEDIDLMFQSEASFRGEFKPMAETPIGGSLTLFMKLEGLKELYQKIKDQVEVVVDFHQTFYGMNEFTIRDLNGYYITLAEPV